MQVAWREGPFIVEITATQEVSMKLSTQAEKQTP